MRLTSFVSAQTRNMGINDLLPDLGYFLRPAIFLLLLLLLLSTITHYVAIQYY